MEGLPEEDFDLRLASYEATSPIEKLGERNSSPTDPGFRMPHLRT